MLNSPVQRVARIAPALVRRGDGPLRGAAFAVATLVVNAANYGVAVLLGRVLGPAIYGPFASFMALFLLVTLIPSAFQLLAARSVGRSEADVRVMAEAAVSLGAIVGAVLFAVATTSATPLALPAAWWWALAAAMPGYALLGLARGVVQGRGGLDVLGGNLLLEALVRVGLIALLVAIGLGASGAVAGTLLALPIALRHLRNGLPALPVALPRLQRAATAAALPMLGYLASQAILVQSDVLIANVRLDGSEPGLFAAVATVGRIVFFGSIVVTTVVFARVAASRGHDLPWLWAALGAVAAGGSTVIAWAVVAPDTLVTLLFGTAFLAAGPLLAPYAVMTTIYALAHVIGSHTLALRGRGVATPSLLAAAAHLALLAFVPADASSLIVAQLLVKGALAVALVRALLHARKGDS